MCGINKILQSHIHFNIKTSRALVAGAAAIVVLNTAGCNRWPGYSEMTLTAGVKGGGEVYVLYACFCGARG